MLPLDKRNTSTATTSSENLILPKFGSSKRLNLHKSLSNKSSSAYATESTCGSSGVSMNCSEEFSSDNITIDKSDDFTRVTQATAVTGVSRDSTACTNTTDMTTTNNTTAASSASTIPNNSLNTQDAVYYFGYGPIVNPLVRYKRGCRMPDQNIQTAVLYDHRLRFVAGGTANAVPSRGWDVKGVLMRFDSPSEWEAFRKFDANYECREVSVSVINKHNPDPQHKNNGVSPFEDDQEDVEERSMDDDEVVPLKDVSSSTEMKSANRMHKSCPLSSRDLLNDEEDYSDSEEDDYSCPFSFEPKSKKPDPNAVKCFTFTIDQPPISRHSICAATTRGRDSVVGKPQARYLKLMTDGLRHHEIDETYIRDEVLGCDYILEERDRVVDRNYRSFPSVKAKLPKIKWQQYENKLCKDKKENPTLFVVGNKVMKVLSADPRKPEVDPKNPCVKWLRALGHGKGDISFVVHQTFVDNECSPSPEIPELSSPDDLTEQHFEWAEHVLLLYLERGGLTATVLGELPGGDDKPGRARASLKDSFMGRSMPALKFTSSKKNKDKKAALDRSSILQCESGLGSQSEMGLSMDRPKRTSTPRNSVPDLSPLPTTEEKKTGRLRFKFKKSK